MTEDRRYPDRPFLAASVAVLRGDTVLVAARAKPPLRGVFTLPGGLVEPGETLAETALRELAEEVGVEAEMIGPVAPVEIVERDEAGRVLFHFVVLAHAARWRRGEGTVGAEALAVRWVTRAELDGLATTRGLAGIVERAFRLRAGELPH